MPLEPSPSHPARRRSIQNQLIICAVLFGLVGLSGKAGTAGTAGAAGTAREGSPTEEMLASSAAAVKKDPATADLPKGTVTRDPQVPRLPDLDAALDSVYESFRRAYQTLDLDLIASLYAEDAWYLSPNENFHRGQEAIGQSFVGLFESAKKTQQSLDITFHLVDRRNLGGGVMDIGIYTLSRSSPQGDRSGSGKFALLHVRQNEGDNERWAIWVDAFNALPKADPIPRREE